jgi:tetratricopeptide (TPR) repeat protein
MRRHVQNPYSPCPCGSGKKYKFCCLPRDREHRREMLQHAAHVTGPDGELILCLDLERMEIALERGRRLVESGRGREAIPHFEEAIRCGPGAAPPHNNLALAYYADGRFEKAVETCRRVDRVIDPGNAFTLGMLVQCLLMLGRREEAERIGDRLVDLVPADEFAAFKKCEALARLRRHEAVLRAASRALDAAEEMRPSIAYFAGAAAANLARYEDALGFLREARRDRLHGRLAKKYARLIERREGPSSLSGEWPYLGPWDYAPLDLIEKFSKDPSLKRYPGFVDSVLAVLELDPSTDEAIEVLSSIETPAATAALRRIAFGTFGNLELRMKALLALRAAGSVGDSEQPRIWTDGAWQRVMTLGCEITPEAVTPLAEAHRDTMNEAVLALRRRDAARAEALTRRVLAAQPNALGALHNLAMALRLQGRTAEAVPLFERAMALDPSYLYAPAALIDVLLEQDRRDEARAVYRRVVLPSRAHPHAYAAYLVAGAKLWLLDGEVESADRLCEMAENLGAGSAIAAEAARLRKNVVVRWLRRQCRKEQGPRDRQRRRLLEPAASAATCWEAWRRDRILSIARALRVRSAATLSKESLLREVVARVHTPEALSLALERLSADARLALQSLIDAGGILRYDEFVRRFGAERDPAEPAKREQGRSILDDLGSTGLAVEGTVGGCESVLVPADLREPVRRALAETAIRAEQMT